jgi:hypothetical protein
MLLLQVVGVPVVELGLHETSEQESVAGAVVVPRLGHLVVVSSRERARVQAHGWWDVEHALPGLASDHLCHGFCC